MSLVPSVRYVKVGGSMVAKPVNVRVSGAWHPVQSVPNAPTAVTATAGVSSANLSWTAPAFTGGIAITGYTVTRSPGNVTTSLGNVTSTTITGLTNGTPYTFTVTATNAVGTGAASSSSNSVTPTASITGSMYISPASGTYHVGDTITITVHEDSLTTPINAVEADLTYPQGTLQFGTSTVNATPFPQTLQNTGGSGSVTVGVGSLATDPTGDQIVTTITFTVLATGTANVTLANSSAIYQSSDSANILNSKTNASFTIT